MKSILTAAKANTFKLVAIGLHLINIIFFIAVTYILIDGDFSQILLAHKTENYALQLLGLNLAMHVIGIAMIVALYGNNTVRSYLVIAYEIMILFLLLFISTSARNLTVVIILFVLIYGLIRKKGSVSDFN